MQPEPGYREAVSFNGYYDAFVAKVAACEPQWVFLVYMGGDNSLSGYVDADLDEMKSVGSTCVLTILALVDQDGDHDTRFYEVKRDHLIERPLSDIDPTWGDELDMSDPSVLSTVTNFVVDQYPAPRLALVPWNHGSGWWLTPPKEGEKGLIEDKGNLMRMKQFREALEVVTAHRGSNLNLVGFDACLMGMLEVGYEIRGVADVMVGSEMLVPGEGWPYDTILADLANSFGMSANELGAVIVDRYGGDYGSGVTMSALDLAQVSPLATAVSDLALAMNTNKPDIAAVRTAVRQYDVGGPFDHIDLYNFADLLSQQIPSGPIHDAAIAVLARMPPVVTAWYPHNDLDHGIAIYFPEVPERLSGEYNKDTILFAGDTYWDEFLSWYYCHLTLTIDPTSAKAGDLITFETSWGETGDPVGLAVTNVNGIPMFAFLLFGTFDVAHKWTVPAVVPPGLSGLVVTFQSYGITACGRVDATEPVVVTFL
ncbi:MAG: clostripain-related cysteine peptidase [Planctomycetota bacterium]